MKRILSLTFLLVVSKAWGVNVSGNTTNYNPNQKINPVFFPMPTPMVGQFATTIDIQRTCSAASDGSFTCSNLVGGLYVVNFGTRTSLIWPPLNTSNSITMGVAEQYVTNLFFLTAQGLTNFIGPTGATGATGAAGANATSYYRAGTTNIGNLATSLLITFTSPLTTAVYSVSICFDSTLAAAVSPGATSKTTNGFTLTLSAGISGGSSLDYVAWPNN